MAANRMSKSEFVNALAEKTGMNRKQVTATLDTLSAIAVEQLGGRVDLVDGRRDASTRDEVACRPDRVRIRDVVQDVAIQRTAHLLLRLVPPPLDVFRRLGDLADDLSNGRPVAQALYPRVAAAVRRPLEHVPIRLVDNAARIAAEVERILLLILPLVVAIAFFLIADIDSPGGGFIRVNPRNLLSLSQSLRAH